MTKFIDAAHGCQVSNFLKNSNISFTPGNWLRLKSAGLDAISVNASSGGWRDHRTGEHGSFRALADKLGLDASGVYIEPAADAQAAAAQDTRSRQWARTQWARGIPAVKPARAHGWSQAAWDAEQAQYQDARDAIYDYLASRGLDPLPLLQMIRFSTSFTSAADKEMQDQGADFWFMLPMYEIGKPQKIAANICGVQRTYLQFSLDAYHKTAKIGRMMLGRKGVTEIQPRARRITLPAARVIGAGEGFETVASFTQSTGHSGLVAWDWTGIKAWSESVRPHENAPTVAFLVDADASETGQRESAAAVRRIVAQEHGKAVYLLPPDSITPDAKGNRDWNDLLQQSPDDFAAEIVKAWHKSDENLAAAPAPEETAQTVISSGPRDAETAQAIADAVARHAASEAMKKGIADYEAAYADFRAKMLDWYGMEPEERKAKGLKKPKLPPMLIKVTTGVGKSHQIRNLIKTTKLPLLILTRTHELAADYAAAGAFAYHGRSEPEIKAQAYTMHFVASHQNDFAKSDCFKYPVVKITSENNHVPALTACKNCEHGRKFMIDTYHEKSEQYKDAVEWFSRTPINPAHVPACLWLSHQMEATHARIVVAPNASFSDTLAKWQTEDGAMPRLVIVDEMPELTREIDAHSGDMGAAIENAQKSIEYMQKHEDDAAHIESLDECEAKPDAAAIINDLQAAIELFKSVGAWLGGGVGEGIQTIPDEIAEKVKQMHVDWLPGATARWEKAEIRYGHEPFVPLRMAKGLIESVKTGTALAEKGRLHVREVTGLGEHISKGNPCILLDATPSRAVESIVRAKGGQILHAIAKQHINLIHFNQYLHGRTWKNQAHQKDELMRLLMMREQMQAETGNMPNILTYMPHCELSDKKEDATWGYFGRDDIGQDRWKAQDLLIFGGPLFAPATQAIAYNAELMLMRLAGVENLPDWSAEIERGQDITVGGKAITSKAPLPADADLRAWVLDDYGRRITQAIGRVRGVWASENAQINVWIAGGLPLAGLAAHGVAVSEYRQEKAIDLRDEKHRAAIEKVQVAMAALQAADQDTGWRAVNKWLSDHGLPHVRYEAWKSISKASTGLNKDTYEPVDSLLASLNSLQKVADWQGADIADVALTTWPAPNLDEEVRAAAEIILQVSPYTGNWRQGQRTL